MVSIDGLSGNNGGIFSLVMWALDLVARPPDPSSKLPSVVIPATTYQITSRETAGAGFITFKLWMARVLLQTMWRWRRSCDLNARICLPKANFAVRVLFRSTDPAPAAFKSNVSLALAIGLGLRVDVYDTYIPDTLLVSYTISDIHNLSENSKSGLTAAILPTLLADKTFFPLSEVKKLAFIQHDISSCFPLAEFENLEVLGLDYCSPPKIASSPRYASRGWSRLGRKWVISSRR